MIKVATVLGEALFDDEDWDLAYHRWSNRGGYLRGHWKGESQDAHIIIAKRHGLIGEIDHEDRNRINNQFSNLREATKVQTAYNRKTRIDNTSGYKGVYWKEQVNKWQAYITVNHEKIHVGYYHDVIEAAKAYDRAAIKYHKEFACLNFPRSDYVD